VCVLVRTFSNVFSTPRRRKNVKREESKIRKREQEIKKKVAVKSRFTYLSKTARGEEEEEEEEEEKEVKKREIYEEENDAVLLRILRRVPHARLRDRSKTTHFGI